MQQALTVIAKIKPGEAAALEDVLDIIGNDIRGVRTGDRQNTYIDFSRLNTTHFCRWAMIPNATTNQMDYLLFTSNYDGILNDHLDEWVDQAGEAMHAIWGCCEGYPSGRESDPEKFKQDFRRFMKKHSYDYAAFHIGYRRETVLNVRRYITLRSAIGEFLDKPAVEKFASEKLRGLVDMLPERRRKLNPLAPLEKIARNLLRVIAFVLDLLLQVLIVFIFQPIRRFILRRQPALNLDLDDLNIQSGVAEIEDVVTQNQITVISKIKPGIFTLTRLKLMLIGINMVSKHFQNQGSLGGITTIHFARWVIIDRGRWLLFTSNYDGSWDSYIGEFVDKAASGMDLIWRSAPRYPEAGSIDIEAFKSIIRVNQVRTHVFYSAYPSETVINILNDRAITNTFDRESARAWLGRL